MRKVNLFLTEKLTYRREVEVEIPDDMSEDDLNAALDRAQSEADGASDLVYALERRGFQIGKYDDSLDSPSDSEVECDDYTFVKE